MTGTALALVAFLADALPPQPVHVAAAKSDSHFGAYAAVAAALAAVAAAVVVRVRRKKRVGGRQE